MNVYTLTTLSKISQKRARKTHVSITRQKHGNLSPVCCDDFMEICKIKQNSGFRIKSIK